VDLLLTLVLSCSVHYDDHLVEALATKLSNANQYFVGDLAKLDTFESARSVDEARHIVDEITARGGRAAAGYMAIPVTWAARFGRSVDDLFDGCINIGVGSAVLSEYQRACTAGHLRRSASRAVASGRRRHLASTRLRTCLLRRLEIDLNITGIVEHVLPDVAKLDRALADPDVDPPPDRAALFPDNTDISRLHDASDWGSPHLFLSSSTAPSAEPLTTRAHASRGSTARASSGAPTPAGTLLSTSSQPAPLPLPAHQPEQRHEH
jgi:hypothetical protein